MIKLKQRLLTDEYLYQLKREGVVWYEMVHQGQVIYKGKLDDLLMKPENLRPR